MTAVPIAPCPTCGVWLAANSDWCYGCGRIFVDARELWEIYEANTSP